MKTYKLIKYDCSMSCFMAKDEDGNSIRLDLCTDSSFPEITESDIYNDNNTDFVALMQTFEGKTIECERVAPYTPLYFVCNGKFKK